MGTSFCEDILLQTPKNTNILYTRLHTYHGFIAVSSFCPSVMHSVCMTKLRRRPVRNHKAILSGMKFNIPAKRTTTGTQCVLLLLLYADMCKHVSNFKTHLNAKNVQTDVNKRKEVVQPPLQTLITYLHFTRHKMFFLLLWLIPVIYFITSLFYIEIQTLRFTYMYSYCCRFLILNASVLLYLSTVLCCRHLLQTRFHTHL